jgi:hypothetical protein
MYALKANVNELLPGTAIPPLMVKSLPVKTALFRLPGPLITYESIWEFTHHDDCYLSSIST